MSNAQFAAYQKRAGELAAARLDDATLDPRNPTKAQIDRIKRILSRTASQAKREVLREIPLDPETDEFLASPDREATVTIRDENGSPIDTYRERGDP